MVKSPLRYPGGKSRAIDLINSLVPDFDEYREPFVGGGSIFINLKQRYCDKKFWINDIYYDLFKFWEIAQNNIEKLVEQIFFWRNKFQNGKELHRFLIENKSKFNEIEIASSFFIFNRITFSGTTESGGFSENAFKERFTDSSIERLKKVSKVLPYTKITNLDYQELIEKDGENVFIFLDPPYYSAKKSALYGKNGKFHKYFDHIRFSEVLKKCRHKWLITYDDSDYIKKLFDFADIKHYNLMYGMRNQTKNSDQEGKELLISNYLDINYNSQLKSGQMKLFAEKPEKYIY